MKKQFILYAIILLLIGVGCVPPETTVEDEDTGMTAIERNKECDLYLSFAHTNYQNRDYRSAIRNFSNIIDLGCAKRNSLEIFPWMTRSYIELSKDEKEPKLATVLMDSSYWSIRQGLKYSPDEMSMLELAAWIAGDMGKTDDQIYYIDKILSIDPENTSILWKIFDIYSEQDNCTEMLNILNILLNIDSEDKKALGELRNVYECLGMDPIEIDKERCENDPSNVPLCFSYAKALQQRSDYDELLYVLPRLLSHDPSNKDIIQMLAETYNQLDKSADALKAYEKLFNITRDYKIALIISELHLDDEDFKNALKWAETAISVSNGKGEAYYGRGEVYREGISACSGEGLTFSDKLGYEMAFEDYSTALDKKYFSARARKESLSEFITTSSDWFMRPDGEREAKPEGACVNWITRTIKRK
ncbi:MAG: hypothetical protein HN729_06965 [Candidatus Marinimicrobia bacterium]|jgi:tetratricopeptide (TPR) repeat protein|nr:hypothetical protein [Candidatus Neomarinimicrobiota bacterium]MBT3633636.1 hypothetical protein [Candidatus Neomarinimicrobiota bacterium]MBT3682411.1 hypothetical protein [Candidatus Neomarinimicrobiota bacterium]MBT3759175.1 hypothetical protein [Candidatus Neomarinimicrobiota bacterium]MBT3895552.1 hypothetical protein [Candidatus Neomarinimicrobiota bacterium]